MLEGHRVHPRAQLVEEVGIIQEIHRDPVAADAWDVKVVLLRGRTVDLVDIGEVRLHLAKPDVLGVVFTATASGIAEGSPKRERQGWGHSSEVDDGGCAQVRLIPGNGEMVYACVSLDERVAGQA